MGAVYQAHDLTLDVACVVKEMMPSDPSLVKNMAAQFLREGKTLAGLRHLSLPRVTNYFNEQDSYYLVMDLIAGHSLESMIDKFGLPEATVLKYGDQLLDVLEYIHGQGVLHRDIKPANIIIQPDDRAVLVDFGLVKLVTSGPQTAKTLVSALSPMYAPPEQYTGNTDQRSDLYSLAATLYQALAGHPPASATDQLAGNKIMPLRQLPHLTTPISANTEYVLMKGLTLDRNARYQDAATMRAELKGSGKVYQAAAPVDPRAKAQAWSPTMVIPDTSATGVLGVPAPIPIGAGSNVRMSAPAAGRKSPANMGIIAVVVLSMVVVAAIAVIVVIAGQPSSQLPAAVATTAVPATMTNPAVAQKSPTFTPAPSVTTAPSNTPAETPSNTPALPTQTPTGTPSPASIIPSVTPAPVVTIGSSPLPSVTPQTPGMLFAAPVLLEPQSGFSYRFPSAPLLTWSPVPNLGPDDYYLLEITHQQGVDPTYLKDTATPPKDYIIDLPRDPFLWRVTVVRKTASGYVAVSPPSAQWEFRWTRPQKTATPKPKSKP